MVIMVCPLSWVISCITLRTLNYGNYGILPIGSTEGLISSTIWSPGLRDKLTECTMFLVTQDYGIKVSDGPTV